MFFVDKEHHAFYVSKKQQFKDDTYTNLQMNRSGSAAAPESE
ncbi:MAG: hypothetical protein RR806_01520 [Oscillospiraceae bacterium]